MVWYGNCLFDKIKSTLKCNSKNTHSNEAQGTLIYHALAGACPGDATKTPPPLQEKRNN